MKRPRLKPWLFRGLSLLLSSVVVFGLAELITRLWFPFHLASTLEFYRYDDELGYRLAPGEHLQVTDHREEVRVNPLGTVNYQRDFVGYRTLVFALGDSYTQGTGNPPDVSYPFQLDLALNRDASGRYVRRYGVVNLGLAAYGAKQALILLRRYARELGAPAYVLYLGCANDVVDDRLFGEGRRHRHLVEGSPHWGWRTRPLQLLKRSHVVRRLHHGLSSQPGEPLAGGSGPCAAQRQWPAIQAIQAACAELGATLILSWVPDEVSYQWLRRQAAASRLRFADWYPAAQSVRAGVGQLPLYNEHSGGHFRPWVYRLIAESFERSIRSAEKERPR